MGKQSQKESRNIAKSKKLKSRYSTAFENKTLTRTELEKFSTTEQITYLDPIIRSRHPTPRLVHGETPQIGGWYQCLYCAKASVFGDGYVSEDNIEN